jgi:SPP1 family predicted phage head-tail adaptor
MNPGRMDRRLTVQVRTLTKDAAGGREEAWADAFDCWGEAVTQKASEGVTADADRATDDRQFRIRYKSGIASGTHRVLYQLKFYDITGITEEGRRDRLLLTCRAVQALAHI